MAFDATTWMTPSGGYEITNSVRWNDPDSSELERTNLMISRNEIKKSRGLNSERLNQSNT